MREVVIAIRCDVCGERFVETDEGSNSVTFTVYGTEREMDLCDPCINGSFLQEGRPVKKSKDFVCHCGKSYTSKGRLTRHRNETGHTE